MALTCLQAVGLSPDESVMDAEMASVDPGSSEDRELRDLFLFSAMTGDCSGNIHNHVDNESPPTVEDIECPEFQTSMTAAATLSAPTNETLESAECREQDEELAEILRQVHLRGSLQSHAGPDEVHDEDLDSLSQPSYGPESIYENLRHHMEEYHDTEILSLHKVRQLVEELTGISPVYDDMCIKGCHAFTGPFADKTECDTCGQSRYLPGTANKRKKSKEGSMAMRYRSQKMEELIDMEASGADIVYDDIYCGLDLRNIGQTTGFTATEDDTFVGLSVDGAQLYQDKKSDTWFGIWIVYDYDPATRYKRHHVLPAFIIPGPKKPKNVESYLFWSFYHLSALQQENGGAGLWAYDAMKGAIISSRIFFLFGTADATAYEKARLMTGISRPSLISALKYTLPPPKCFTVDLMHLLLNNIPELMLSIWRGTIKCDTDTDSKLMWDWATLSGKRWEEHGQLIADAKSAFPSLFHRTPRNPAQKLNSGFKATEYCLYFFGLGPAHLRTLLPKVYWQNYCKLVQGARILTQRRITQAQVRKAYSILVQFVEEFENIYYERRMDRLHFCCPALHTLLHSPKEVARVGPGAYLTQFTLEGTIGLLTRDIWQHSTPFANVTQIAIRRSQWNAMQAIYPHFAQDDSNQPKKHSLSLERGYELRTPQSDHAEPVVSPSQAELLYASTGLRIIRKWGQIKLSNGQVIRSYYQEEKEMAQNRRVSRMVKLKVGDNIAYGKVQFYFAHALSGYAMVSLFSEPNQEILEESYHTILACSYLGDQKLVIAKVEDIISIVSMQKFPSINGDPQDLWFPVEKSGLEDIRPLVPDDDTDNLDVDVDN
ncbi:hypothetical protein H1R20_g1006, partial [Candolleomyces eurysporus]